jgi:DNA-binding CsgD family transcriptional regulator
MLYSPEDMAKTLFFIEAAALALLAVIFPLMTTEAAKAFVLPVMISLAMPLAGAAAVWPPRSVLRALRAAFSTRGPGPGAADSVQVLGAMGDFSRAAAVLGLIFAIAAAARNAPLARGTMTLLGSFLAAYALLNAGLWRILAAVVERLAEALPAAAPGGEAAESEAALASFAARYCLTPRELETASLIARGLSYKEVAYELGISIKTVKAHMGRVYEKTGAASNVGLVLLLGRDKPSSTKVQ